MSAPKWTCHKYVCAHITILTIKSFILFSIHCRIDCKKIKNTHIPIYAAFNETHMHSCGEWVICSFTPTPSFSAISWREQVSFQRDDDEISFVLDHHA